MFAFPQAAKALLLAMFAAAAVSATHLVLIHSWSWFALSASLLAPAIAMLTVLLVLRLARSLESPANVLEAWVLALLHSLLTAAAASLYATASPMTAADAELTGVLDWPSAPLWLALFVVEGAMLSLAARVDFK